MTGTRWLGALLVFAGSFFGGGTLLLLPELVGGMESKNLAAVWLAYFLVSLCWALAVVRIFARFRLPLHRVADAAWGEKGLLVWHFLSLGVVLPAAVLSGGYFGGSLLRNLLAQVDALSNLLNQPETGLALLSLSFLLWVANQKPQPVLKIVNLLAVVFLTALLYNCLPNDSGQAALLPSQTPWPGFQWVKDLSLLGYSVQPGNGHPGWSDLLIVLVLVSYNAMAVLTVLLGELACGVNWGFGQLAGVVLAGKAMEGAFTFAYVLWLNGEGETGTAALLLTGILFLMLVLHVGPSLLVAGTTVQELWRGRPWFGKVILGLLLVTGLLLGKGGLLMVLVAFGVLQGLIFLLLYRAVG